MRKLFATCLSLSVILITIVSLEPASADNRLSGAVAGRTVFFGSPSTYSVSGSIGERTNAVDWSNLKVEIRAANKGTFSILAEFSQQNTGRCGGTTSNPSGGRVTCTVALTSSRSVLDASVPVGTGAISNSVRIIQTSGDSQIYRLRAWIDRNNNDQIDPYEPATRIQSINTVDPHKAKAFYNFEVDPPRFTEGKITAWFAAGARSNQATDLLDPSLVSMRVRSCSTLNCSVVSGSTTYNSHPQLLRYEFTTTVPALDLGTYSVELYYQQDQRTSVLLDTKIFEYKQRVPAGVKTEIIPQVGTAAMAAGTADVNLPRLHTTVASPGISNFTYRATFSDTDQALVAKRAVYVLINTTELDNPSQLRVNGAQVTGLNQDLVVIRRDTDSNGVLTLNLQYPGRSLEQLKIDIQVNGFRSYEFAYPGREEAIFWENTSIGTISLSSNMTSGSKSSPLTVTATVSGNLGGSAQDGSVIFYGDPGFTIESTVVPLSGGTSASSAVSLSNFAPESGTGYVYAQALSASGWITAQLQLAWSDYGNVVSVVESSVTPDALSKSITINKGKVVKETTTSPKKLRACDAKILRKGCAK